MSYEILGKSLTFADPQFPYMLVGLIGISPTHLRGR